MQSDTILVQQAAGSHIPMLALTVGHHAQYCASKGIDYRPVFGELELLGRHPYYAKVKLLNDAAEQGYKNVIWLDADTIIADTSVDLRDACTHGKLATTYHAGQWHDESLYNHHNTGAVYISLDDRTRRFLGLWWQAHDDDHGWHDQHAYNLLLRTEEEIAEILPHRWNSTPLFYGEESPVVVAYHGHGNPEQRTALLKHYLTNLAHTGPINPTLIYHAEDLCDQGELFDVELAYDRAHTLQLEGNLVTAERIYRTIVGMQPDHDLALRQLGVVIAQSKRLEEAKPFLESALRYNPTDAPTLAAYGGLIAALGDYDGAVKVLNRACAIAPDHPGARFNRAAPRLMRGNFAGGWADYEYGLVCKHRPLRFLEPQWNGRDDLNDKTLYAWAEQGAGDAIQFVQLLQIVRDRYPRVEIVLETRRDLASLFDGCNLADYVTITPADFHKTTPFDHHISLMSLPAAMGLSLCHLPAATNYIQADPMKAAAWKGLLASPRLNLNVGICTRGNPDHFDDDRRSIKGDFSSLLEVEGCCFTDLYLSNPDIHNWTDTAAAIANLDVVVSVDTGVAHLSAAMGIPTWIMLPYVPDFRWMAGRSDSPWYPSVKLYRQSSPGGWNSVFDQVKRDLLSCHPLGGRRNEAEQIYA